MNDFVEVRHKFLGRAWSATMVEPAVSDALIKGDTPRLIRKIPRSLRCLIVFNNSEFALILRIVIYPYTKFTRGMYNHLLRIVRTVISVIQRWSHT